MSVSYIVLAHRATIAKWFMLGFLAVLVVAEPRGRPDGLVDLIADALAFVLVAAAVMGRVWASIFISGHKNRTLVTEGPYSVVRNPLYLFSLMGAMGIGVATGSVILFAGVTIAFVALYTMTVSAEEAQLEAIIGEPYRIYRAATRMLVPRWRDYREPDEQTLDPRAFRRALRDTMWFVWLYGAVEVLGRLHERGVLPTLIRLG